MNQIRTIYSILITLCWSIFVLLYIVSHKQLVSHVTKLKYPHTASDTSVDEQEQQQMCLLHFSTNYSSHIRIVRNTDSNNYLPVIDFWKTKSYVTPASDASFLYFSHTYSDQLTADRVVLFKQFRI
jgi:uncharacterized protein YpuA (DUF1002 family)